MYDNTHLDEFIKKFCRIWLAFWDVDKYFVHPFAAYIFNQVVFVGYNCYTVDDAAFCLFIQDTYSCNEVIAVILILPQEKGSHIRQNFLINSSRWVLSYI